MADWDKITQAMALWWKLIGEQMQAAHDGDEQRLHEIRSRLRQIEPLRREYIRQKFFNGASPHFGPRIP